MPGSRRIDIGLIGACVFASASLLAASAMTVGGSAPRAAKPITWQQATSALMPAVPPAARAAFESAATKPARPTPSPAGVVAPPKAAPAKAPSSNKGAPVAASAVGSNGQPCQQHTEAGEGHEDSQGHKAATVKPAGGGEAPAAHTTALPAGCPYADGTVSGNAPSRVGRKGARLFYDPTGGSPWEVNYYSPEYAEEDCGAAVPGSEATVMEPDPAKKCTMTNGATLMEGDPADYYAGHGHHTDCRVKRPTLDAAFEFAQRTRDVVSKKFDNQPWVALAEGHTPFPVPGTKTFHMFRSASYSDRETNGAQKIFDPAWPEMFTYAMTDDGLVVVNVVYAYTGTAEELPDDRQADWFSLLPRPLGCIAEWHAHYQGAEGPATGNLDGRAFMAHVWTYPRTGQKWNYGNGKTFEGVFPFGEYGDGTEPMAWFTPFRPVPALCNKDGGCI